MALTLSTIQWASPNIIGIDGYYHIKMASILRDQGWRMLLPLPFPWLPTTVLNPDEFTNHHLLFHLALVPFTFFDLRIGAKLAAVIFGSFTMLMAYQLMVEHRVRFALVWLLVMMASAFPFLYRISMTRRQSLTVVFLLLALFFAFRRQTRWLVAVGFGFSWLFDGFPLLLGVCGAALIGEWWSSRRIIWGMVGYPALGILLGTLLNPYFPNNVLFSYLHMLPKVAQLLGIGSGDVVIQVGTEWYPYNCAWLNFTGMFGSAREGCFLVSANWLAMALVPLGLVPILLDPRWSRLRALDGRVVALGILAGTFLLLFLRSRRWIEAEPVFATLFCAMVWTHALPPRFAQRIRAVIPTGADSYLAVCAALAVAPLLYLTVSRAMDDVEDTSNYLRYRSAATWLAENSPPGSRIFATDWDDFPELFYWNTHNVYFVGLDPTYWYLHDAAAYLQWRSITRGQVERPGTIIRDQYDAPYVFTDRDHQAFLKQAANDPGLTEVYRDNETVIFRVNGWRPKGG
ncbi:MAG: hypothetical protein U0821_18280 [Chloroflexota bacterium]